MKPIHVIVTVALAGFAASAFAGPDWEVINRARLNSAQARKVADTSAVKPNAEATSRSDTTKGAASNAPTAGRRPFSNYR